MSDMQRNRGIVKRLSTKENIKEAYQKIIADGHDSRWDDIEEDGTPRWIDSEYYTIVNDSLFDISGAPSVIDEDDEVNDVERLNDTDYRVHAYYYNGGASFSEMLSHSIPEADANYEKPADVFYAVKMTKLDRWWTRDGSPSPALFLTEEKARKTVLKHTAQTEDKIEVVMFSQV